MKINSIRKVQFCQQKSNQNQTHFDVQIKNQQ